MSDKKHTGRSFNGKGYYIALILCAAAIGITGYLYYRNVNEPSLHAQDPANPVTDAAGTQNEDVAAVATQPGGGKDSTPTGTTGTQTPVKPRTASPISGAARRAKRLFKHDFEFGKQ